MTRDTYYSGHAGRNERNRMPAVAYTFDTLAAAKELEASGIERGQAEAIVALHVRSGEQLATKADLEPLATKALVWQVAGAIVLANAALTAGLTVSLIKLL